MNQTPVATSNAPSVAPRFGGLDVLRLLAIAAVTVQHALTVVGREQATEFAGTGARYGQIGVGLFCAISGFLAFQNGAAPGAWFRRRLARLYPAFWLVMIIAFAMTWWDGRKTFGVGQLISQMLGLGYFTHGFALVNMVTWFVSLILLCYALAWAAKRARHPAIVLIAFAVAGAALMLAQQEHELSRHVIVFSLAGLAAMMPMRRRVVLLIPASVAMVGGCLINPHFAIGAICLPLLAMAVAARWPDLAPIRLLTVPIYEYFLVHGIAFSAAASLLIGWPVKLIVITGLIAAIINALVVRYLTARLVDLAGRLKRLRPPAAVSPSTADPAAPRTGET